VKANDQPVFVVRLRPQPNVDPIKALRWFLRSALRRYGLLCIEAYEEPAQTPAPGATKQANKSI